MIQKAPGVEDIFPDKIEKWNFVQKTAREVFAKYNFKEIIFPIMEFTEVFSRGLGDETDIVSKEMFTFEDRGGRSLTLRPEGTASTVRAFVENGEFNRLSINKFFYSGPMFRAEKPQRGRLRQFNQIGAELFGGSDPYYDFEIIAMINDFTHSVGIEQYEILLNSIGCTNCREKYILELKEYYKSKQNLLCEDCKKRLTNNTLRLLDCKQKQCLELKTNAPLIKDFLDDQCREHFTKVKQYLQVNNIPFTEAPHLVRGLDYYNKTTFEFVSNSLGGQNAFAAGGRYDSLVERFGGNPTPAIGFAAGVERILLLIENKNIPTKGIDAYIIHSCDEALNEAVSVLSLLREKGFSADFDPSSKSFKSQFKKADREKAKFAIVIGEDELKAGSLTVKDLVSGKQQIVAKYNLIDFLLK
jgi:histidyl-tRNA synthetase